MAQAIEVDSTDARHNADKQLFIVTFCEPGIGTFEDDPSFTAEVLARNHDEARGAALQILRRANPGRLRQVWFWCSESRYWDEGNDA